MPHGSKVNKYTYFQSILENLTENIYWMDREGRILGCNDQQAIIFGFNGKDELVGKNIYDVGKKLGWDPSIPAEIASNDQEVMRSGQPKVSEETVMLEGQERVYLASKYPLRDERGDIIGIFGVARDITERKQSEVRLADALNRAEAADETKRQFLMSMRHDFRTPFMGILSLADMLYVNEQDPEKKEHLGIIRDSAESLLKQHNEIFEYLLQTDYSSPVLQQKFDIYDLLKEQAAGIKPATFSKAIDLKLEINPNTPRNLLSDQARIARILMNLLSNAVKFTDKGYISILADLPKHDLETNKAVLRLQVKDTGMGIPSNKQVAVFETFKRLEESFYSKQSGKGLGLRLVRQCVDDLNGEIELNSAEGRGTTFTVLIPVKVPLL